MRPSVSSRRSISRSLATMASSSRRRAGRRGPPRGRRCAAGRGRRRSRAPPGSPPVTARAGTARWRMRGPGRPRPSRIEALAALQVPARGDQADLLPVAQGAGRRHPPAGRLRRCAAGSPPRRPRARRPRTALTLMWGPPRRRSRRRRRCPRGASVSGLLDGLGVHVAAAPAPRGGRGHQAGPDGESRRRCEGHGGTGAEMRCGKNERPCRTAARPGGRWASTDGPSRCCIGL